MRGGMERVQQRGGMERVQQRGGMERVQHRGGMERVQQRGGMERVQQRGGEEEVNCLHGLNKYTVHDKCSCVWIGSIVYSSIFTYALHRLCVHTCESIDES
jgi:hypothetical protein